MLAALIGICAFFGLAVGSFLNVVIYRVPRKESIVSPRSRCPSCGATILARDNIPVASWILLRGRCRNCHTEISGRYPLIELLGAAVFGGLAARLGYNWDLPAMIALMTGLLALSFIDLEHMILPKVIVYPMMFSVAGLLLLDAGVNSEWHRMFVALLCAAGWFLVFGGIYLVDSRFLGLGDVRLAPALGLGLGWLGIRFVILGFFAANLIGAVVGLTLIGLKRMSRDQQIPYGVFLALGAAVAIYAGPELLDHLHRFT